MDNLKKKIVTAIMILASLFMVSNGYADDRQIQGIEDNMNYYNGSLYINGSEISAKDTILYNKNNVMLFPMRRIFEELGAMVDWDDIEQNTVVTYNGEQYVCKISPINEHVPNVKALTIQNKKNLGRNDFASYIQLNNMGVRGSFCIINDYTYLYEDTAQHLFEKLGCKVEIDTNSKAVYISSYN